MSAEIRVGFIGAGYIARWHAEAIGAIPGVRLAAVCDPATTAAEALAAPHGASVHAGLDAMLAEARLDAVHVLTPPNLHAAQTIAALEAGCHVFCEKPFAHDPAEAEAMVAAAERAGRVLAVNHNFLGLPSVARLKRQIAEGRIGRIDRAEVRWHYPLAPLRSGPFGLWMLRAPGNLLLELGPHLYAFVEDLLGPLDDILVRMVKPIALPGGREMPQGFVILGKAGTAEVTISLSLVEGGDDRSVTLRGVAGTARLDFGADVLVVDRPNTADIVANPLVRELSLAGQHVVEGLRNAGRQLVSLNRRQPYALGFRGAAGAFYAALREGRPVAAEFSGAAGARVVSAIARTVALLPAPAPVAPGPAAGPAVDALVIGGTGFIGRALVRTLVAAGHGVRVLSRGSANPFADLGAAVEISAASVRDPVALAAAMRGVTTVYHLAKAEEATWEGYLRNDVAVTEAIAAAALEAGVRRFVYTGTIASYDASDPARTITEDTPFGPMEARNLYARSKALCEERLLALHRGKGLPLVIARPGIVVGAGGPLQHWGIGRWAGAGAVKIWGTGRNVLPFVLVEDVAEGLLRMGLFADGRGMAGLEGQSFNLIGAPMMTARDYFDAIFRVTGTRIRVRPGRLGLLYLGDVVKYRLKRHVLRKHGVAYPSRADWLSRGHLSPFSNERARRVLGWQPEAEAGAFARAAVGDISLFGF